MSTQTISGRHRARLLERMRRRVLRAARRVVRRRTSAARPRAGAAYERELLTPRLPQVEQVPGGRIGFYAAPYAAAAPLPRDEVRLLPRPGWPGLANVAGIVFAVHGTVVPVVVAVPGVGMVYRDAWDLELIDRPAARTLTMPAVDAELAGERAW